MILNPNPNKRFKYSYIAADEYISFENSNDRIVKRLSRDMSRGECSLKSVQIRPFGWKNLTLIRLSNAVGQSTTLKLTKKQFIWNPSQSKYIKAHLLRVGDQLFSFVTGIQFSGNPTRNIWKIEFIEYGGYHEVMELTSDHCTSYYLGEMKFGMVALQHYSDHSPTESFGIIAFRHNPINQEREYLLVRRRHTMGYMDIIRGKYCDRPVHEICQTYLQEMTREERERIIDWDFQKLWYSIWNPDMTLYDETAASDSLGPPWLNSHQYEIAKSKFHQLPLKEWSERLGLSQYETAEHGFPKGRANFHEDSLSAALREFSEEVGIQVERMMDGQNTSVNPATHQQHVLKLEMDSSVLPFVERFRATNGLEYVHTYYLAMISDLDFVPSVDHSNRIQTSEIGGVEFCNLKSALQKLRYYDRKKKEVLIKVDAYLRSH